MTTIRVHDLSRVYPLPDGTKRVALAGLDMEVQTGEFVCLLGPSGCGKSTLLNILSGLDRQFQGRVEPTPAGRGEKGPVVGYMFQDPRLLPWLTVGENLGFVLDLPPRSAERRERIETWLARVGLGGRANDYPRQLSEGMRQRVAVARALIVEPEILLLDEPFSAVDELTGLRMRRELMGLWEEARCTVIFVTHNPLEAVYLADRVLLMGPGPGRIFEEIEVGAELTRPRDLEDGALWDLSRRVARRLLSEER